MPKIGDVEGALAAIKDGRMAAYKGPTAGRKLSQVSAELIAAIVKLANECQAPAALDFLLRGARIETKGAKIAPVSIKKRAEGAVVHWIMSAGRQPLFAITGPQQSELWTAGDNRRLGIAERDEIADHAVRAATGAVKLD